MSKDVPKNAIVIPYDFKGKKSFSTAEYTKIRKEMKQNKVDFLTAYNTLTAIGDIVEDNIPF